MKDGRERITASFREETAVTETECGEWICPREFPDAMTQNEVPTDASQMMVFVTQFSVFFKLILQNFSKILTFGGGRSENMKPFCSLIE